MIIKGLYDEKEVLLRLQDGDYSAFTKIYDLYKTPVARNLLSLLKDDALVEDTLQELFFRLWENRQTLDPSRSVKAYLYRIATNLAHDHFRRLARDQRYAEAFWSTFVEAEDPERKDTQVQNQLDEALYRAIELLPPMRKKVFLLCKMESKSYQEVSELLHISVPAVRDHIVKANKFLKRNYFQQLQWSDIMGATFALSLLRDLF